MAPSNKAKAAGVSASSFLDLKAELAKHESDLAKKKASGSSSYVTGVKRPEKKPSIWAKQNKGVAARSSRDVELEVVSRPTLESARAALERKAKIYDKLRKGKTGGLSEKQYDSLLVDFDTKTMNDHYESDSDDLDESLTVPKPAESYDDDPIVEYEDEFGRIRSARRSEVPRNLAQPSMLEEVPDEDPNVIYNPVNHFPVYEPSADRVAAITEAASDAANPLEAHYDASKEVRTKGAAFYTFSGDEETRRKQMEELKATRVETEQTRKEMGAVDVKPGEVEGMRFGEANTEGEAEGLPRSRATEKRKREIEERRKLIEAKRRKVAESASINRAGADSTSVEKSAINEVEDDPFSKVENSAVVRAVGKIASKRGKDNADVRQSEADKFLADLEREMLGTKTNR